MTLQAGLVLAILAQGALALALLFWMGRQRVQLVSAGKIRVADIALSGEAWPEDARKAANAFDNQFQLPVLFYVAAAICLAIGIHWLDVLLAWGFVLSRIVHALIHVTSNHVYRRFYAYTAGFFVLIIWWILLIVRVVTSLGGGA